MVDRPEDTGNRLAMLQAYAKEHEGAPTYEELECFRKAWEAKRAGFIAPVNLQVSAATVVAGEGGGE